MLKDKTLSFRLGCLFAFLHALLFIWSTVTFENSGSGQAVMGYFYIIMLDVFLTPLFSIVSYICGFLKLDFVWSMIILFGIGGTVCWFYIPQVAAKIFYWIVKKINKRKNND